MILIYSPYSLEQEKIDNIIEMLTKRLSVFFVESDYFIYSTETNQKLLRELILNNNIKLVYVDSIKELGLSPTVISELIIFLLKNNIDFKSEIDNIYFSKDKIDTIYPTIFEIFKIKS